MLPWLNVLLRQASSKAALWQTAALALAVSLASILPLLAWGPSCGHDFDFHLQSWFAVNAAWHAGLPVPHWVAGANYGAGEPRLVFYPPLSWLLGAALGFVLPWGWVPAAFTGVCFAGTAAAMHHLASRFCLPGPAALAAVLYAECPYLLFTGYERTAYGELLAAVWMPLLLLVLLQPRLPVVRTALLLATLWYTNAPGGVMGCYLLLLAFLWKAGEKFVRFTYPAHAHPLPLRSLLPSPELFRAILLDLARYGGALLLGCALAADYLLPAWYEQRFVAIERAVGPGMRVEDSFLFGHTGELFHDAVLRTASWISLLTLGVGLAGAGMLLRHRFSKYPNDPVRHRRAIGFLLLLVALCLLLQFRPSVWLWHTLPKFAFLQFPWRLLLPGSAAVALLVGMVFSKLPNSWRFTSHALALAYAAALMFWAGQTRYQPCDAEDTVPAQLALLSGGAGFEGTDEYAPAGSDNGEIQQGLPEVRLLHSPDANEGDDSTNPNPLWKPESPLAVPGTVKISQWSAEQLSLRVHPSADAYAVLRLERLPAWRISLNGKPCANNCMVREDGLMTIHVPAARWSTIAANYRPAADIWWGRAFSLGALLTLPLFRKQRANLQLEPLSYDEGE